MQWIDEGIVLGFRRLGESGVILELMTRAHGRHLGFVHGGRSRRMAPVLQPGNSVEVVWRARIDEQLGHFTVEPTILRAARLMGSAAALFGVATLASHLRLLAERDPHPTIYDSATILFDGLDEPSAMLAGLVRFELALLGELGFGLDLSVCASTGSPDDLAFVSPKSGRAVGRLAGERYRAKLLVLPPFLLPDAHDSEDAASTKRIPTEDVLAGFRLTGFFLDLHVFDPRGQTSPVERTRLIALAADRTTVSAMIAT